MRVYLNTDWTVRAADGDKEYRAAVPATAHGVLLAAGDIPDPYKDTDEKAITHVAETDWIFSRTFDAAAQTARADAVRLVFKQLDTVCSITLNGTKIADVKNCHRVHSIDVKGILKEGENTLLLYFRSPVNYVLEQQKTERAPINSNGLTGISHLRKPHYHFGWDWGPVIPVSGITGDVYIETAERAEITGLDIVQHHTDGAVTLDVLAKYKTYSESGISCKIMLTHPDGHETEHTAEYKNDGFYAQIELVNPQLWWTRELSGKDTQPLYGVCAVLYGDGEICRKQLDIGLRTIELSRSFDEHGQDFAFVLNGVRIFAKGASIIPPENFPDRVTDATFARIAEDAAFANFNMIRVWGGGYYGAEALYRECDRRGILIWQDFMYACQAYPFFLDDFMQEAAAEARDVVTRLKHHASLALWCGNNEIEQMCAAWMHRRKYISACGHFFYDVLPSLIREIDSVTPYIPGSPVGVGYLEGANADNTGDTHLWAVWHGLKSSEYYRGRKTRFCSEFGLESMPAKHTLASFSDKEEMNFGAAAFASHQKCRDGNAKMRYYISSRHRLPKNFYDYVYFTQLCQADCIADAVGCWRSRKGLTNGTLFWQLNDCWPTCSWSSVDYNGSYKALHYKMRRSFAAISLYAEKNKKGVRLHLLNDSLSPVKGTLAYRIENVDGKVLHEISIPVEATANSAVCAADIVYSDIANIAKTDRARALIHAELISEGKVTSSATELIGKEKNITLPDPDFGTSIGIENGVATVEITSRAFADNIVFESTLSSAPFSDNWFSLPAGGKAVVTQRVGENVTTEEYSRALSIVTAADFKDCHSNAYGTALRAKLFLKPSVFVQWFYYGIESTKTRLPKQK